jgi:CDP-diacylglycerol--glycerol-3-phosphate 3-phosphatidyltransferase
MLYLLKGNFQKVIRWLAGSWMSANLATVLGCVFIVLSAAAFYFGLAGAGLRWLLLLVPVFLLFRMAMNALDGLLSREYGTATAAGEVWNETFDIFGDTVSYGILYFVPGGPKLAIMIFIILTWAAEYYGVLGKGMPGGKRRHEALGGGKADRAFWMGLLAFLVFFNPDLFRFANYYIAVVSCLVALTCVIRIRKIMQAADGQKYESFTLIGR